MLDGLFYYDVNSSKLYNAKREEIIGADLDYLFVLHKIKFSKCVKHLMIFEITPNILSESELKIIQIKKYHTTFYSATNSKGIIIDVQHVDMTEDGRIKESNLKSMGYEIDQTKR